MSTTTNTTDAARILAAIRRSWPQRWPWFLALAAFLLLVTGCGLYLAGLSGLAD